MLSSECVFLLNFISKNSSNGYFVEDVVEIAKEFPSFFNIDEKKVIEILNLLKNYGYISVKYNDGEKVCVTSTAKGTVYLENINENSDNYGGRFYFGLSFFGGFLGGFIGTILVCAFNILIGG